MACPAAGPESAAIDRRASGFLASLSTATMGNAKLTMLIVNTSLSLWVAGEKRGDGREEGQGMQLLLSLGKRDKMMAFAIGLRGHCLSLIFSQAS